MSDQYLSRGYRPDIDGLRAVSILVVVGFHAGIDALSGGYVGVDVFFVLSGYLITGLLIDEHKRAGRIDLKDFYARRVRRLLPLAALVIVSTTVIGFMLMAPLRRADLIGDARAASLYLANWRYAGQAVAYSEAEVGESLFLHFWSLSIEEQFYLFWPAMIIVLGRVSRRSGRQLSSVLTVAVAVLVLVSLVASVLTSGRSPATYYLTQLRVWELGAGAGLALLVPRRLRPSRAVAEGLSLLGLALICVAALTFDRTTVFPGYAAILPVLGCALLVWMGATQTTWISSALSTRPMTYIGRISYAWYLWHWPVIGIGLVLSTGGDRSWEPIWVVGGAVLISLGLAAASHALVEQPIRRGPGILARTSRSLALGALLTIVPVLIGSVLLGSNSSPAVAVAAPEDSARDPSQGSSQGGAAPDVMTPEQAANDLTELPPDQCHARFLDTVAPIECVFGTPDATTTVVLVGDSHAQQWLPALDQAGLERDWSVMGWSKSSCTVIDVPLRNNRLEREYYECFQWRESVLDSLKQRGHADLIVIGDSYNYGQMVDQEGNTVEDAEELLAAWRLGAIKTFRDYAEVADRVALLRDTPWSRTNVPDCLSEDPTTPERCAFPLSGRAWLDEEHLAQELDVGGEFVAEVDMTDFVCSTDPCMVTTDDGIIKYRDGQHLTATFSRSLAGPLGDALEPLLIAPGASGS